MMAASRGVAAFLLAGVLALAEDGWARLDRLAPGRVVTIHLRSKEKARGAYVGDGADSITISREDGSKLTAAKNDVARLLARRRVAGKAAAAGALAGWLIGRAAGNETVYDSRR